MHDEKQNIPGQKYVPVKSFNQYAGVKSDPKDVQYKGLTYNRSVDGLDRSKRPGIGAAKSVKTPTYWKAVLPNGLEILGTNNPESKRVNMFLEVEGGQLLESNGAYPLGTATMTAGMMNEGTQKYTAVEIEKEIDRLGSSIRVSSGRSSMNVSVACYRDQITPTMQLFEQRLLYPNFDNKQFKKDQKAVLQSFRSAKPTSSTMVYKGRAKHH